MQGNAKFKLDDDGDPGGSLWCSPSEFRNDYEYGNSFYSINAGPVHFISTNCYGKTSQDSAQYRWLESDLSSVDRDVTPFVLVSSHCPWYSTNINHYMEWQTLSMMHSMEPLFLKYEVNLVITGHVHAYQRSLPVYNFTVQEGATVYIVVGDGGNREGHAKGYIKPDPEWSAFHNDSSYGHGTATVYNSSHMLWRWHINQLPDWVVSDETWITRKAFSAEDSSKDNSRRKEFIVLVSCGAVIAGLLIIFAAVRTNFCQTHKSTDIGESKLKIDSYSPIINDTPTNIRESELKADSYSPLRASMA